jgi:transposase InsO family protein
MDHQIIDYVRSCLECQKDKAAYHKPYGLLSPLELPYTPWTSLTMDFITDLPLSEDCDQLWVIMDRFTKMAHFIPLHKDQKKAEYLVKIFAREIWRFHGIPTDIISDRDSRFTSMEWKQFLGILGVRPWMSTSFHPQTDSQTERINQTIEAYLRSFINYKMDNWVGLLPIAEFAYNNSIMQATSMSPFHANYGRYP